MIRLIKKYFNRQIFGSCETELFFYGCNCIECKNLQINPLTKTIFELSKEIKSLKMYRKHEISRQTMEQIFDYTEILAVDKRIQKIESSLYKIVNYIQ